MNLRVSNESAGLDDSLSNDTRENPADSPSYAFAEVVTLKYPHRYINLVAVWLRQHCSRYKIYEKLSNSYGFHFIV